MSKHPVSDEVAATLGAFVSGGDGPRHSVLTRVFGAAGYGEAAAYDTRREDLQPNKEDRVRATVRAAVREPARSRELVDGLLAEYRAFGFFTSDDDSVPANVSAERRCGLVSRPSLASTGNSPPKAS